MAGCIDNNISRISEDFEITSGYSVPGGPLTYNINDYLETLDSINIPWHDSVYFNDTLYPNYRSYLTRDDTIQFDFNRLDNNLDKVESIMFRLIITNGYPTETITQVYFTDDFFLYVDSVFAGGPHLLKPATVNDDGIVTSPYEEILDVYMSPDFVNNMADIRNIMVKSIIYTTRPDIPHVKLYTDYAFNVHIAARIQLRFNTSDF